MQSPASDPDASGAKEGIEMTTFYQKNYTGWPPISNNLVNDPESKYWHERAMEACALLVEQIGEEQYHQWLDEIGEPKTWHALYKAVTEYAKTRESQPVELPF